MHLGSHKLKKDNFFNYFLNRNLTIYELKVYTYKCVQSLICNIEN